MGDINDLIAAGPRNQPQSNYFADVAKQRATQYQLGAMAQEKDIRTQQLASGALTLANEQKTFDDNKAVDDAMATNTTQGPDGKPKLDRDGVISALTSKGRGMAASRVQAQFDAQDMARAKAIEAQNAAQTSNLNLVSSRATELAKLAGAVKAATPEGKQAAYQNMHTQALRLGLITPEMQSQFPDQYDPSQDPHIDAIISGAQDAKTQSDLKTAELTRGKDEAQIAADKLKNSETWRVTGATQLSLAANPQQYSAILAQLAQRGAPPDVMAQFPDAADWSPDAMKTLGRSAMTQEQRVQADRDAATLAATKSRDLNTQLNDAALRRQGEQRIAQEAEANRIRTVAADPFGALGLNKTPAAGANPAGGPALTGTEFLGTLPPAMATRVQHIASGAETLSAREKGSATGQALITAVEQYDKGWSEQRGQLRKAFATGPDGRNIGNLNTAAVHLTQLADLGKAMQNGSLVPGNQLYNAVVTTFGKSAVTSFNGMKTVVAGEMASAMKGNATDPEIASFNASVNAASSPAQLADVIANSFVPALATKLNTYNERYHVQSDSPGMAPDPWTPVLPSARAAFARFGIDPTPAPAASATPAKNPFRK